MPVSDPIINVIIRNPSSKGQATISWTTTNAIGLKLNGQPVGISGSKIFQGAQWSEVGVRIILEATGPTGLKTTKNISFRMQPWGRGKF